MPMRLKQKGKKNGDPTELVRYDVYLHERRDQLLIEHLAPHRELRTVNQEIRRLLYAALGGNQPQPAPVEPPKRPEPVQQPPIIQDEPNSARAKMKRMFG